MRFPENSPLCTSSGNEIVVQNDSSPNPQLCGIEIMFPKLLTLSQDDCDTKNEKFRRKIKFKSFPFAIATDALKKSAMNVKRLIEQKTKQREKILYLEEPFGGRKPTTVCEC